MSGTAIAAPWTRADAVKVAVCTVLGAVIWAVGWYRVAQKPAMGEQIAPLNLAIVGAVVIGGGYAYWFLTGRRAVGARRGSLLTVAACAPELGTRGAEPADDLFVGSEHFFHRISCALALERTWVPMRRDEHDRAGRVPCGVCAP